MAMAGYGHGHGHWSCRAPMAMAEEGEGRHPLGIPLATIRLTHICVRSETGCGFAAVVGRIGVVSNVSDRDIEVEGRVLTVVSFLSREFEADFSCWMLDVESVCLFWKPAMIRFGGAGIVVPPSCIGSLGVSSICLLS